MPSKCPCGQKYNLNHAMNFKRSGFVDMRLSNVRDFEANLLIMIQKARPDIRARGVWRQGQNAFFEIRLTNVNAKSQKNQTVETILKKYEKKKKRPYNSRIMNVEHGTFTPLVFS